LVANFFFEKEFILSLFFIVFLLVDERINFISKNIIIKYYYFSLMRETEAIISFS